ALPGASRVAGVHACPGDTEPEPGHEDGADEGEASARKPPGEGGSASRKKEPRGDEAGEVHERSVWTPSLAELADELRRVVVSRAERPADDDERREENGARYAAEREHSHELLSFSPSRDREHQAR